MNDLDYLLGYYRLRDSAHFQQLVKGKIGNLSYDKFLLYWRSVLPELEQSRPQSVKCVYRYDCTIAINKFVSKDFRLQIGDVIFLGAGCNAIHIYDTDTKIRLRKVFINNGATEVKMSGKNLPHWSSLLSDGKIALPLQTINAIMESRGK